MLKSFTLKNIDKDMLIEDLRKRQSEVSLDVTNSVTDILKEVRNGKDKALKVLTQKFDGVEIDSIKASEDEINKAFEVVEEEFINDLKEAKKNIEYYHKAQVKQGFILNKSQGVFLGQRVLPLNSVGVYVPGGTAAYPSTVLMNIVPAKVAGVENIVMVTPPNKNGSINPYIAVAAKIAGVDNIYKVGGAQAVAALAYGTETVLKVDKIVGPGNIFVATAKKLVYGEVDIDMIAGPSEILIVADEKANARYVAADLMSQAEHDKLASAILITTSEKLYKEVELELKKQVETLERKEIIKESLKNYGKAIICDTIDECLEFSNIIAPEHLELMIENSMELLGKVKNAGSVFLGYNTTEPIGDYFGGTNHVLPTNGTARFFSPLSVESFVKKSSFLYYSKEAIKEDGEKIINLANKEGLTAHANSVKVRLENERN